MYTKEQEEMALREYERLQAYAEDKGQTMTMAVERLLTKALDAEEKKEDN